MTLPVVLTIAGSDSGGGAGIQADIKSMQANGVFAASVLTALTAQNTQAVTRAMDVPLDMIEAQVDAVCDDFDVAAVKTGMLSSAEIIASVAHKVDQWAMSPLVVDPVMISATGFVLLKEDAIDNMINLLIPKATLVTPNTHEAAHLTGIEVQTVDQAKKAAEAIHAMGAGSVLVKGGHLDGETEAIDIYFDGEGFVIYSTSLIDTPHTHGTGCTYASAIAAHLARGTSMKEAIRRSKSYVTDAIRHGLSIGKGNGPTNHFYFL